MTNCWGGGRGRSRRPADGDAGRAELLAGRSRGPESHTARSTWRASPADRSAELAEIAGRVHRLTGRRSTGRAGPPADRSVGGRTVNLVATGGRPGRSPGLPISSTAAWTVRRPRRRSRAGRPAPGSAAGGGAGVCAAARTAAATAGVTRGSNTLGTITVGLILSVPTTSAIAWAAAMRHLLGELLGVRVEHAAEHTGEGEHVVDLVGLVRTAGGDHGRVLARLPRVHLRIRVGQREDDRLGAIVAMSSPVSRFGALTPMKTSAPRQRRAQVAGVAVAVGVLGQPLPGRGQLGPCRGAGRPGGRTR